MRTQFLLGGGESRSWCGPHEPGVLQPDPHEDVMVDGRVCSGSSVPTCKMGTVSALSARDSLHPGHQVMAVSLMGLAFLPQGGSGETQNPRSGVALCFRAKGGVISGGETSALLKVLSHISFVFFSTHAVWLGVLLSGSLLSC